MRNKLWLVTGSSGLIGSEVAAFFHRNGFKILGIDNNQRESSFGSQGSTLWNQECLAAAPDHFEHRDLDIRNRPGMLTLLEEMRPVVIIPTAAQHSLFGASKVATDVIIQEIVESCQNRISAP